MFRAPLFGYDLTGQRRALRIPLGHGAWWYGIMADRPKSLAFGRLDTAIVRKEYPSDLGIVRAAPDVVVSFYSKAHAVKLREMLDQVIEEFDKP